MFFAYTKIGRPNFFFTFFFRVLHTILSHLRAHMPLPARSLWSARQPYRPSLVDGTRGGGPSSVVPRSRNPPTGRRAVAIHRLGVVGISPSPHHCFRTAHPCAQSVSPSLRARQQSQSSPDPAGKDSGHLQSNFDGGWHVRLSGCLSRAADESSGFTVCMKLFRDFNLLADDVISRFHLHLCLLDVRFIAQSSVKVDAQVHWCCCV